MSRPETAGARAPGVRLIFAYDADGIRLLARLPGPDAVPPGDDVDAEPPVTAIAAELRTAEDVPTFRRVVDAAIPASVEVFDPDTGPFLDPRPPSSGAFDVVVPDDERARQVVLLAGAEGVPEGLRFAPPPAARAADRVIARFDLRGGAHGAG
ncbi:MAG TPA: hypothetical protein VKG45_16760 [Actinomycetes bacterium]|nr:hypothetical protein [Actinomycetes bacterium]